MRSLSLVEVTSFTDPVCPWSWGLEPATAEVHEEEVHELEPEPEPAEVTQ